MDKDGNLRMVMDEELQTMENLDHPVECTADIPEWKLAMFRKVDKGHNRAARLKIAKKNNVDWNEYMIYRHFKPADEVKDVGRTLAEQLDDLYKKQKAERKKRGGKKSHRVKS